MNGTEKTLAQSVIVKDILLLDNLEGILTVQTKTGQLVSAFFYGEKFQKNEQIEVEFSSLGSPLKWETIFSENKQHKIGLEKASGEWEYYAYGKILSINPIIADFGDIKLSIGEWTHDDRVIGEYIFWKIDRLDISKFHAESNYRT